MTKYFDDPAGEYFLAEDGNLLEFWKKRSELDLLQLAVRRFLAIQASSAAVERDFKRAKDELSGDRAATHPDTFECRMLLAENQDLFDQALEDDASFTAFLNMAKNKPVKLPTVSSRVVTYDMTVDIKFNLEQESLSAAPIPPVSVSVCECE